MAKKPRRGRGEGSVEQLADGRWKGRLSGGKNPATGKRVRRVVYGKTKAEVLTRMREYHARGIRPGDRMSVAEWLDRWLAIREGELEYTTLAQYACHVNTHIKPLLGAVRLDALTPVMVVEFYARLACPDPSKPKVATTLQSALKDAVRMRLIGANPAEAVRKPRRKREPGEAFAVWGAGECRQFLASGRGDRFEALYALALDTGMRQGELFGLHWPEVDFAGGAVKVVAALAERSGTLKRKAVKTAGGRRTIRLHPATLDALFEHRKAMLADGRFDPDGPVFCDSKGGWLRKSNFRRWDWLPALRRSGCKRIRFHDLRHTCATLLLTRGVNIKAVAARLGHENAFQTLKTYAHVLPETDPQIRGVLDAVFGEWAPDGHRRPPAG